MSRKERILWKSLSDSESVPLHKCLWGLEECQAILGALCLPWPIWGSPPGWPSTSARVRHFSGLPRLHVWRKGLDGSSAIPLLWSTCVCECVTCVCMGTRVVCSCLYLGPCVGAVLQVCIALCVLVLCLHRRCCSVAAFDSSQNPTGCRLLCPPWSPRVCSNSCPCVQCVCSVCVWVQSSGCPDD